MRHTLIGFPLSRGHTYQGEGDWIPQVGRNVLGCGLGARVGTVAYEDDPMTTNKKAKRAVRKLADKAGKSYQATLQALSAKSHDEQAELLQELDSEAATGLDMSPGNPLAARAAAEIRRLSQGKPCTLAILFDCEGPVWQTQVLIKGELVPLLRNLSFEAHEDSVIPRLVMHIADDDRRRECAQVFPWAQVSSDEVLREDYAVLQDQLALAEKDPAYSIFTQFPANKIAEKPETLRVRFEDLSPQAQQVVVAFKARVQAEISRGARLGGSGNLVLMFETDEGSHMHDLGGILAGMGVAAGLSFEEVARMRRHAWDHDMWTKNLWGTKPVFEG